MCWVWYLLCRDLAAWPRELLANVVASSPLVPRPLRCFVYRALGLEIHTLNIYSRCRIVGRGLRVGPGVLVNSECYFDARAPIEIGARSHLGMRVTIVTSSHAPHGAGGWVGAVTNLPVSIGEDAWIGACCTLLPGTSIGPRTVIAAGAVVTGHCEPDALYAGVPARKIRGRAAADPVAEEVAAR